MHLLKKKEGSSKDNTIFQELTVDLHSHLLPSLDDGASSIEESLEMICGLKELGFSKLIITPHICRDYYNNSAENIREAFQKFSANPKVRDCEIALEVAAEYRLDDYFIELLNRGDLLSFGGHHILVELPFFDAPRFINEIIFELQIRGYNVVLAHPERYLYWKADFSRFLDLKDRDVYFQVNLMSFAGYYNPHAKKLANRFAAEGMIDFLGSDLHTPSALAVIKELPAEKELNRLVSSGAIRNKRL